MTRVRAKHMRCSSPPDKVRASWPSRPGSRATRFNAVLSSSVPASGWATARLSATVPGNGVGRWNTMPTRRRSITADFLADLNVSLDVAADLRADAQLTVDLDNLTPQDAGHPTVDEVIDEIYGTDSRALGVLPGIWLSQFAGSVASVGLPSSTRTRECCRPPCRARIRTPPSSPNHLPWSRSRTTRCARDGEAADGCPSRTGSSGQNGVVRVRKSNLKRPFALCSVTTGSRMLPAASTWN